MAEQKKRVALALGSGGARGLAHIGVIHRLEEMGYEIGYLAGTSIGALVGGIYAAGALDTYEGWARELTRGDMLRLLDFSFNGGSIFKGDRVIDAIRELIGDRQIEDLPIGFTAVATDLVEQSEVWLRQGSLFKAIRASTAIPSLLSPVRNEGRLLADGGLVNPIPIAPTLNYVGDFVIAVDLNASREGISLANGNDNGSGNGSGNGNGNKQEGEDANVAAKRAQYQQAIRNFIDRLMPSKTEPKKKSSEPGFLDMTAQTLDIMQNAIARLKLAAYRPDVVIHIPRDICQFWEFDRAAPLIEFGYERALEAMNQFERVGKRTSTRWSHP
jgi:NTE family protein